MIATEYIIKDSRFLFRERRITITVTATIPIRINVASPTLENMATDLYIAVSFITEINDIQGGIEMTFKNTDTKMLLFSKHYSILTQQDKCHDLISNFT